MNLMRVVLLISCVAWLAGNVLMIVLAPVLFSHAPNSTTGGGHDFSSHFAAGAVFGDCLRVWSVGITYSLLPATLCCGVVLAAGQLFGGHSLRAVVWIIGLVAIALLHLWSEDLIMTLNQLLTNLLSGQAGGEHWRDFNDLHRESRAAVTAESAMALVLILAASYSLIRGPQASPKPNE